MTNISEFRTTRAVTAEVSFASFTRRSLSDISDGRGCGRQTDLLVFDCAGCDCRGHTHGLAAVPLATRGTMRRPPLA